MDNNLDRLMARTWEERMSRRRFLKMTGFGMGAVALGPILAACRGGGGGASGSQAAVATLAPPSGNVNLNFWNPFTGPDGPFMARLVEQFNDENPTIKVAVTTQADYYTKLRTAAQANRLPHVGIMHLDAIPQNAEDGLISPIDDLIELLGLGADDFTEAVWNNGLWKDKRYGIPNDIHPFTMYWNKDLLADAGFDDRPKTGDELRAVAQALNDNGIDGPMWSNHAFDSGMLWSSFFYQAGGTWTNEDYSEATFNSDAGVQATEFMKSFVDDGLQPANVEPDAELPALLDGSSGLVFSGPWQLSRLAEGLGDKLGAGPVPQAFDNPGVWAGSHHLSVFEGVDGDERQAAYFFINWITGHTVEWAKAGQVPARKSVRESDEFKALPHIPVIAEQVDAARFFPEFPGSADLMFGPGGASEQVVSVLVGDKEVEAALNEGAERYTRVIQETKDKYGPY
ncbi:MAG: ABC transporter substrate-binding protein [Chloroflexota bacterium]|nr:ABC transporter substrate-binding protein [Chloroflexota bacterium]